LIDLITMTESKNFVIVIRGEKSPGERCASVLTELKSAFETIVSLEILHPAGDLLSEDVTNIVLIKKYNSVKVTLNGTLPFYKGALVESKYFDGAGRIRCSKCDKYF